VHLAMLSSCSRSLALQGSPPTTWADEGATAGIHERLSARRSDRSIRLAILLGGQRAMPDQQNERSPIVAKPIVIDEDPMFFWDYDDPRMQIEFLNSIDPQYFRYVADVYQLELESGDAPRAAVALRLTYSHALETLFALIGASLQAPYCPAGWLLRYRNRDLHRLVEKGSNGTPLPNKLDLNAAGWSEVAHVLLPSTSEDDAGNELREASAILWHSLARNLLDGVFTAEYNSLKHGFRVRSGDFHLAIGREDVPGVPPPPERMQVVASNRYGSMFLRGVSLKDRQWGFEQQRINWDPALFVRQIPLVADSIHNVLSFLKFFNGIPVEDFDVCVFDQESVSEALADPDFSSATRFSIRVLTDPNAVPPVSKEVMMEEYLNLEMRPPHKETTG